MHPIITSALAAEIAGERRAAAARYRAGKRRPPIVSGVVSRVRARLAARRATPPAASPRSSPPAPAPRGGPAARVPARAGR